MLRFLKFGAKALAVVLVLAIASGAGLYTWSNGELAATVPVPTHEFTAPRGDAAVARGEHVTKALAKCADCHADDFGGKVIVADPAIGTITGPNLTTGRGGVLGSMSDADIERAVRHGVTKEGRRLLIMPANEYQNLSDEDMGVIIAYLRTVPPVDREPAPISVGPVARALYAAGKMPWFPSDFVTHRSDVVAAVTPDSTIEYGQYLVTGGCAGCHGPNLSGGTIQGAPPDWPQSSNLTPTGLATYDYAAFVKALTDGVRPDGTQLHPVMPVQATKLMTPVEMTAIWKYLGTVAAAETGVR